MLLTVCLVLSLSAIGAIAEPKVEILRSNVENDGLGNYEFWYEQSDGTKRWQTGVLKQNSKGQPFVYTTGGYAYYDQLTGVLHTINFVADENGYHPTYSEESPPAAAPPRFAQAAAGG